MSESLAVDRLYALQVLERVQLQDLERTRRWIADAERQAQEEQYRLERAAQPRPEWIAQAVRAGPVTVHTTLGLL
ncbi:hypothetical protein OG709_35700 (plasmid) [Streptomyces sp. NBC_01267]|uniref:hypothetical protein n=1 Tax=Streptomyces sp. NBC_01267 TaxID=2903805 RepID=UPI002E330D9B|nr:hypothetical protein [Streptomyces sp. NBC_01267]